MACKEIRDSSKWLKLLQIILAIGTLHISFMLPGNFLNGSRANAKSVYGFKVKTLLKIRDTKSTDNKTSLLDYIAQVIDERYPELNDFQKELEHVEPATRSTFNNC